MSKPNLLNVISKQCSYRPLRCFLFFIFPLIVWFSFLYLNQKTQVHSTYSLLNETSDCEQLIERPSFYQSCLIQQDSIKKMVKTEHYSNLKNSEYINKWFVFITKEDTINHNRYLFTYLFEKTKLTVNDEQKKDLDRELEELLVKTERSIDTVWFLNYSILLFYLLYISIFFINCYRKTLKERDEYLKQD